MSFSLISVLQKSLSPSSASSQASQTGTVLKAALRRSYKVQIGDRFFTCPSTIGKVPIGANVFLEKSNTGLYVITGISGLSGFRTIRRVKIDG